MKTTGLGIRPYEQGLSDLGGGSWAYLQPDGSWWSNAGLITDGEGALLVGRYTTGSSRSACSAPCAPPFPPPSTSSSW